MSTTQAGIEKPKIGIGQYVRAADGSKGIVLEIRNSPTGWIYSVVDSNGRIHSHQEWSLEVAHSKL